MQTKKVVVFMDHYPVMLKEVLESLSPKAGEVIVDGTFGAGGYSKAILESAECRVIAIDRDPSAIKRAQELRDEYKGRFVFIHGRFGDVQNLLQGAGFDKVDGFVLDLGVSSMQLDEADRGFSFRFDADLDMRMDFQGDDPKAADLVNGYAEKDLADLIYKYGEERYSRRIARAIVNRRKGEPIKTTGELADIVRGVLPFSKKDKSDPATRTFQALRIAVNDELGELEQALESSKKILNPDGRLVVVSFHSLEDRIAKQFLRGASAPPPSPSRHMPETSRAKDYVQYFKNVKDQKPSKDELAENSRSRSARLRLGIRTQEMQS